MNETSNSLAVALFSEILTSEQLIRNRLSQVLPKGMEVSHFSVLNHLAWLSDESSPAQLARNFHVTRAAMTNTISKLELAGYVHVRPDWDDARRKWVSISPAGNRAREVAMAAITPMISGMVADLGEEKVKVVLPVLRDLRARLKAFK